MVDDREWKIPPDFERNNDRIFIQSSVPRLWHIPLSVFQPIWDSGIDGRGINIAVNDTGFNRHINLPNPIAIRNFTNDRDTSDGNGHSVHCAGTALGRDGLGIAPKSNLIIAKVMNSNGSGNTSWINAGREWAAKEGADIISESYGSPSSNRADIDSILRSLDNGAKICVAAAGNSGFRGSNSIGFPARYLESCCVGAHDINYRITTFSSGGREMDVATPGQNIISASHRGGYVSFNGTSMACPFFAGLMALVMQKRRMSGYPDINTMDGWREFFKTEGFFKDIDIPGVDHRSGLGAPLINNILSWFIEPKNI